MGRVRDAPRERARHDAAGAPDRRIRRGLSPLHGHVRRVHRRVYGGGRRRRPAPCRDPGGVFRAHSVPVLGPPLAVSPPDHAHRRGHRHPPPRGDGVSHRDRHAGPPARARGPGLRRRAHGGVRHVWRHRADFALLPRRRPTLGAADRHTPRYRDRRGRVRHARLDAASRRAMVWPAQRQLARPRPRVRWALLRPADPVRDRNRHRRHRDLRRRHRHPARDEPRRRAGGLPRGAARRERRRRREPGLGSRRHDAQHDLLHQHLHRRPDRRRRAQGRLLRRHPYPDHGLRAEDSRVCCASCRTPWQGLTS